MGRQGGAGSKAGDDRFGEEKAMEALLRFAGHQTLAQVGHRQGTTLRLCRADGTERVVATKLLRHGLATGLLRQEGGRLLATPQARSFLRRRLSAAGEDGFAGQHRQEETDRIEIDGAAQSVRINRAESPLGLIARMKDRSGAAFLSEEAVAAADRLHADFTRGQLQPRVTASWEPRLSSRGDGGRGGAGDIADSALSARARVNRAVEAMGPELAGVALDVCCFMKGLEVVERERQWPARSAKLMLRTALLALARHYRPPPPERRQTVLHWGAEDYRPSL